MHIKQVSSSASKLMIVFCAAAALSACATMTAEQCQVADWYQLGRQDALAGHASDHLARRAQACSEAGFGADSASWHAGFDDGLIDFCTADNGFRFGLDGGHYQRSCPAQSHAEFDQAYRLGSGIYTLNQRVASAERELDRLADTIAQAQSEDEPDRDEIRRLLERRDRVERDLRRDEIELGTLRGLAQGRGFSLYP